MGQERLRHITLYFDLRPTQFPLIWLVGSNAEVSTHKELCNQHRRPGITRGLEIIEVTEKS